MAAGYEAGLEVLRTHLESAGATITPPASVVRLADDVQMLTSRQISVQYAGDEGNPQIADSLIRAEIGEKLVITCWFPTASHDKVAAEKTELDIRRLNRAITSRLEGDRTLGGNFTGLALDNSDATKWMQPTANGVTGPWIRLLEIPLTVGLLEAETDTIAN